MRTLDSSRFGIPEELSVSSARIHTTILSKNASLHNTSNGYYLSLKHSSGITAGQYAAWYINDEFIVLGF
jgi:hypothetical protein